MKILVETDPKNRVPKDVTTEQRAEWAKRFVIYDVNSDGSLSAPVGPTDPDGVTPPASSLAVMTPAQAAASKPRGTTPAASLTAAEVTATKALVSEYGNGAAAAMSRALIGRSSVRKLAIWGDSVAAANAVYQTNNYLGGAFVPQALYMAGNPMDLVAVGGNSGNRTDQMISTYASQIGSASPDAVIICAGTNDIIQSYGADYALNGVSHMARLVEAGGAVPIMMTLNAGESFTATEALRTAWFNFNTGLRALCLATGWPLFDAATAYIDPASPIYAPLPGYTDGAVHPRNAGATADADVLAAVLRGVPRRQLAQSANSSANASTNTLLTGTSGTLQSGASGQAPTGCTLGTGGTGWTGVSSVAKRIDGGPGNWWQIASTQTAAAAGGCFVLFPAASLATAGFAVGDVLRYVVDAEVDAGHSGLLAVRAALQFTGGNPGWAYSHSPEAANGNLRAGAFKAQLRTVEIPIPSGTTSISLYVYITGLAGVGAFTVRLGNPSCIKVS